MIQISISLFYHNPRRLSRPDVTIPTKRAVKERQRIQTQPVLRAWLQVDYQNDKKPSFAAAKVFGVNQCGSFHP
ncbi:MAG: hypothetical protein PUC00_07455 [Clostridiales bacterium]|nr:hypothetical protein [Clostridiales bacterium]